jgi:hypothetical protein
VSSRIFTETGVPNKRVLKQTSTLVPNNSVAALCDESVVKVPSTAKFHGDTKSFKRPLLFWVEPEAVEPHLYARVITLYTQADIRSVKLHCIQTGDVSCILTELPDLHWRKHGLDCVKAKLFSPRDYWGQVLTWTEFQSSLKLASLSKAQATQKYSKLITADELYTSQRLEDIRTGVRVFRKCRSGGIPYLIFLSETCCSRHYSNYAHFI